MMIVIMKRRRERRGAEGRGREREGEEEEERREEVRHGLAALTAVISTTDLEKKKTAQTGVRVKARNRHFGTHKHPLAIALLQRAACVVSAKLSVHLAACSARL